MKMDYDDLMKDEVQPQTFHQLGVFILDGSGSMTDSATGNQTKADAVNTATRELISRLQISSVAQNISLAIITFDNKSEIHTNITPINDIDSFADYNPLNNHGGGTDLEVALKDAKAIVDIHMQNGKLPENEGIPHSVTIVVMSDGASGGNPIAEADKIKEAYEQKVQICAAYFSGKNGDSYAEQGKALLQSIVSNPNLYATVYSAEQLRKFFMSSMSSSTNYDLNKK